MPATPPGITKIISKEDYKPGETVTEKETGKIRVKLVYVG